MQDPSSREKGNHEQNISRCIFGDTICKWHFTTKKTKLKRPKTEMKQNKDKSGDNQHNELFDVV